MVMVGIGTFLRSVIPDFKIDFQVPIFLKKVNRLRPCGKFED